MTWSDDNLAPGLKLVEGCKNKGFQTDSQREDTMTQSETTDDVSIQILSDLPRAQTDEKETFRDNESQMTAMTADISKYFNKFADKEGRMSYHSFKLALGKNKDSFFADRFFQFLDSDSNGYIDMAELSRGVDLLLSGSQADKISFIFKLYDMKDTGVIDKTDLRQVLTVCAVESHMHLTDKHVETLTEALFDEADTDKNGQISPDEFRALLDKYPDVLDNLTFSAYRWLYPTLRGKPGTKSPNRGLLTRRYLKNNAKKIAFISFFGLINVVLFCVNAALYSHMNGWIIFARGCGLCLDFNSALVLLLPLRLCLTYLRNTPLSNALPLDDNITLHKIVGFSIVLWSVLHTIGHIGNAVTLVEVLNLTLPAILFTADANLGWIHGLAPATGVVLMVVALVMMVMSLPFVRRSGHFQLFYWSHKLYFPYYILTVLHATHFWKWLLLPGCLYLLETAMTWSSRSWSGVCIETVNLLPSAVTQLIVSRPQGFKFSPGDYVYLKIPAIARYEWHPFTISSAPEQEDTFSVHIRSAGHWTDKVRKYFLTYNENSDEIAISKISKDRRQSSITWLASKTAVARAKDASIRRRAITKKVNVQVFVGGPYGSACREIFNTEHAVLIGSGIGVTPFASILQSITNRFKAGCVTCPACHNSWCEAPTNLMKLKKVDFIWINRDQRHFEWFTTLLGKIEREQAKEETLKDAITMHMYMTGAPSMNEVQGIGVQVALDIVHTTENADLITGLRTRTQAGRPDFDKVSLGFLVSSVVLLFQSIISRAAGKIKVFMCGSSSLAKCIKSHCLKLGLAFSKEQF